MIKNSLWAEVQGPRIEESTVGTLLSFYKEDLEKREWLKACLVGQVVGDNPSASALREWGKNVWRIGGELQVRRLTKGLFLFYFPSVAEAKRVLQSSVKKWTGGYLLLDVWHPSAGCRWKGREPEGEKI